jgi:5-formyltetrahydrofolate cyclo-ligase
VIGIRPKILYNMVIKERSDIIEKQKEKIRNVIVRRLAEQDPLKREERSFLIQKKLLSSGEFMEAKTVLAYVSLPTEVNTEYFITEALKQGKRVGVPYIVTGNTEMVASEIKMNYRLEKGPYGIYQPYEAEKKAIPLKEIDLVIVPAVAYDEKNMRLGRGKGYYDIFLAADELSLTKTIGIAFNFQKVKTLPTSPHDRAVDRVITD